MKHFKWGATAAADGAVDFAIWLPDRAVALVLEDEQLPLTATDDGWHHLAAKADNGSRYGFLVDGTLYPDPASRRQERGVHGLSVVDATFGDVKAPAFDRTPWPAAVVYEMHVGTFTREGTFAAAAARLRDLADLGVTHVQLMPIAQFDGRRGWGYDQVLPFAIHPDYGNAGDLDGFIAAAHALRLSVILDVVYNHFGPSGNYLAAYHDAFFDHARSSPWGPSIAFGEEPVLQFFLENACYWVERFGFDGYRLDAVHAYEDPADTTVLDAIGATLRERFPERDLCLITEDERNLSRYLATGADFDATWNDDYHHAVHVALTGEDESYYRTFAADPLRDLEMALRDGYVEQGQERPGEASRRGERSAHLPASAFVNFLGNHDQVGNRARGERLHHLTKDECALTVLTAVTLLAPFVPMIFMGDEFLSDSPFQYFVDFDGELAVNVREGRRREFAGFQSFCGEVPDPTAGETFERSRIGEAQTDRQRAHREMVRRLLAFRHEHVRPLLVSGPLKGRTIQRNGDDFDCAWTFGHGALRMAFGLTGAASGASSPGDFFSVDDEKRSVQLHFGTAWLAASIQATPGGKCP